jgi:hypothetical protein
MAIKGNQLAIKAIWAIKNSAFSPLRYMRFTYSFYYKNKLHKRDFMDILICINE